MTCLPLSMSWQGGRMCLMRSFGQESSSVPSLSLDNICPHTQVAKGFLQTCPQDTTKFIGFYKQLFLRIPTGFLVFLCNLLFWGVQVNISLYLYSQGYISLKGTYGELKCFIKPFTRFETSSNSLNSHQKILFYDFRLVESSFQSIELESNSF